MKKNVLVLYCLVLFVAILEAHSYFRYQFSGLDYLRRKTTLLEEELERERFRLQLTSYQFNDFKQTVASLVPQALEREPDLESSYPLRNLASVLSQANPKQLPLERAGGLYDKGKQSFRENLFEDSNETFQKLIAQYPDSVHVIEAYFLLAEGQFQLKDFNGCIETIETMISLFPESDLTGFALLRLGKIFELQDRLEDAADIYRTVVNSYSDGPLLHQAKLSLKTVEL